jgi:hypothetical protein
MKFTDNEISLRDFAAATAEEISIRFSLSVEPVRRPTVI